MTILSYRIEKCETTGLYVGYSSQNIQGLHSQGATEQELQFNMAQVATLLGFEDAQLIPETQKIYKESS